MNRPERDDSWQQRDDPVRLHELPSAGAHDPIIVDTPGERGVVHRSAKWCLIALSLLVLLVIVATGALEGGAADHFLAQRARAALQSALGPDLAARIGGASIRIAADGTIKLRARGVSIIDKSEGEQIASARAIDLDLAALPLLGGAIDVRSLDVNGVALDPEAFGSSQPVDIDSLRVDSLGRMMDHIFSGADRFLSVLRDGDAKLIRITDTKIGSADGGGVPISIESMTLTREASGALHLAGTVLEGSEPSRIEATATTDAAGKHVEAIDLRVDGLDTRPFLIQASAGGSPSAGIATKLDLSVSARRRTAKAKPLLRAKLTLEPGQFFADGTPSDLKQSVIHLNYSFDRKTIDIAPSVVRVGKSVFPFSGGIIDLSNLPNAKTTEPGFAFDLVSNDAVSEPLDANEPRLPFSGKIFATYLKKEKLLMVRQMAISTPLGSLAGSLQVTGGGKSPEISFVGRIDHMQTRAVKELWPYWIARHAREWMLNNLYGGSISDGSIKVFVPKDKIADSDSFELGPTQLQIDFDYQGARLNIAGDIPPLRDAKGHLKLRGGRLDVSLDEGTAYFPTGRKVSISKGVFSIPETEAHPLMGELDITVAGQADAVAELVSYDPINALQRTDFKAGDFSGNMTAHLDATFGLLQEQHPPKPVWKVEAKLDGVDLKPQVEGHHLQDLDGTLVVDPFRAVLDTDTKIDGFPMHLALTEPLEKDNGVKRERVITATLGNTARKALLPGLNDLLDGPVDVTMTRTGEGTQSITADLTDTKVMIPGLGWTKGAGVAAKASFTTDDDGKTLAVDDFALQGNGFSAGGKLTIANGRLASASFPSVKLSPKDTFSAEITHGADGYHVDVDASAIDLRSLIKHVKDDARSQATDDAAPVTVSATADVAYGFNKEQLTGLSVNYSGRGSAIGSLDLRGVTGSGEALVAKITPDGDGHDVEVTCGDGGAVARFTNVYAKLDGGLLNLRLRKGKSGPYRGTLDLRNFSVLGEGRLNSIVSAKPGHSGHSLRETVHQPLDLSAAQFQRGFADLELGSDYLTMSNGVLRGVQVGATFQGTVFDADGNMNMTGTFMPAYGLNRLFADVPIVGALLGNGRDRGLIGITFRLTGKTASPRLEVNPLSIIAPGIFRQIFEY